MKFGVVLVALLAVAFCDYEQVLQSPGALMNLFSSYSVQNNKHYTLGEKPMRLRLFRSSLKRVVQLNKEHGSEWQSGLNQFSDLTKEELSRHLGLNVSRVVPRAEAEKRDVQSGPGAEYLDWRSKGKVTGIKNQGGCGSCWAFAAVGAVETNYAIMTGRRKQFSEQEYLDCSYNKYRDGCNGGWYEDAWKYSKNYGRLATSANVPYTQKDNSWEDSKTCNYRGTANGLMAASIQGSQAVSKGESNVITQLNSGAVSVAYEVTDDFFKYTTGIISDNSCKSGANHAVTAVGYTRGAMIVRNSWGVWGMNGYFYTRRGHHGCQIYDLASVPIMQSTGHADTDPEYVPVDDDKCDGTNADGCPCGTVRCSSGVCKHAHMCH